MTISISTAHRAARNQASIDMADTGPAPSCIKLYTAEGGTLLATRTLANPAGTINAQGRIVLAASAADLVAETGSVGWAEWCDSAGAVMAAGTVTDQAGAGDFKLAGTSGTTVYQGGRVLLDDVILG